MSDRLNKLLLRFGPPFFVRLLGALYNTCRIEVFGKGYEEEFLGKGKPVLYALWHFSIFYSAYHFRNRRGVAMVSASKDGELMAETMHRLGYETVRGSRTKGGLTAMKKIAALVDTGLSAGIVVDGSQGPAQIAQKGIIFIARETGAPIIPVTHATTGAIRFSSWDRTVLSLPWSRLAFFYGPPLFVPPTAHGSETEQYRKELEERLNRLVRQAEEYLERQ